MSLQKAHCHERGRTLRVHSSEHAGSRGEVVCGPVDKVTAVALLGLVSTQAGTRRPAHSRHERAQERMAHAEYRDQDEQGKLP
jgi:hypothetical protein